MSKYIYILPYKIEDVKDNSSQIKILTQKSSLIIGKSPSLEIMSEILNIAHGCRVDIIYEKFKDRISISSYQKLIFFLRENHLIYLSDDILRKEEIRFLEFLSQYTISLEKYHNKMKFITFQLVGMSKSVQIMKDLLDNFGLNNTILNVKEIDKLDNSNIILACYDSAELDELYDLANKIERKKGLLWMFSLFYDDSFLLSPILNQVNYTDFASFKNQIDLEVLKEKGISRNELIQKMGICEMVLDILTSIMKLNIQTAYNKTIVYDSLEKSLLLERIYYFPLDLQGKELSVKRWDGEA